MRSFLEFEMIVQRKKWRSKRSCKKQVDDVGMKLSLSTEDALC